MKRASQFVKGAQSKKKKLKRKRKSSKDRDLRQRLEQEVYERNFREQVLKNVTVYFRKNQLKYMRGLQKVQNLKEWKRYTNCNQMPYPEQPTNLRQYFLTWCHESEYANLEKINADLSIYYPIFELVQEISDIPLNSYTRIVKSLREMMMEWKSQFVEKIDYGCFLLIKEIDKFFTPVDYYTSMCLKDFKKFNIGMWALLKVPMKSNCERDLPEIFFENLDMIVTLPPPYNIKPTVLRAMYTEFDFFSDSTHSRYQPQYVKPGDLQEEVKRCMDLKEAINEEIKSIEKRKEMLAKGGEVVDVPEPVVDHYSYSDAISMKSSMSSQSSAIADDLSVDRTGSSSSFKIWTDNLWNSEGSLSSETSKVKNMFTTSTTTISTKWGGGPFTSDKSDKKTRIPVWDPRRQLLSQPSKFTLNVMTSASTTDMSKEETDSNKGNLDKWSHTEADLLHSIGSKNLSLMDLIFCAEDNRGSELMKEIKSIRDLLVMKSNDKSLIDIDAEVKSYLQRENDRNEIFIQEMTLNLKSSEINLREYHSFCGIYYVDLIRHTSDMCKLKMGDLVQMQLGPYKLEMDNYIVDTDIIEIQKNGGINLVGVQIYLRQDVLWLTNPFPALWDEELKMWSNQYVYEVMHGEDNTISFKLGKLGPIGMFTPRFDQLPYKNWTLSPSENGETVTLTLEGQDVLIEFIVENDKVCLNKVGGYSAWLPKMGQMVYLNELIHQMRCYGLDVFPEDDSFLYIQGCSGKTLPLEKHTYFSIAMFSKYLEFTASSWNWALGCNEIALRCRYCSPNQPLAYRTFKANNFRCDMLMIEDEDERFSDATNKEFGFFPDLYSNLMKLYGRSIIFSQSDLSKVYTVYKLLHKTRVLTYSGNKMKVI